MVNLGEMFGQGSIAEQFLVWQLLGQFATPLMAPMLQSVGNEVWKVDPSVPVPPDILAGMVNRGLISEGTGKSEAEKSGTGGDQFDKLVQAAGIGPAPAEALEMLRRGLIPQGSAGQAGTTLFGALKESGIKDEWAPFMAELKVQLPTIAEVMNAWLEGQIDEAEARERFVKAGGDPTWFQTSYNANGSSPTPDMLGTMANRRIIPWDGTGPSAVTYAQGFLEGPWRNKWEPAMRKLAEYLPPPRTVTALIHEGSITDAQALDLFEKEGLSAEMAAAYVKSAHHTAAATTKDLTQSQILALDKDGKIDQAKATQLIEALGYSAANVSLILDLANVQKADTHVTAAINRVHAQYTARHLNEKGARDSLKSLKVPADQITYLMDLWDIEIGANVKQLTAAQISTSWLHNIMSEATALAELHAIGYSQFDAWVLLSIANKGPLKGSVPPAPITTGVNP